MTDKDTAPKPIAAPEQSEVAQTLADGNFEAKRILDSNAVQQGAHFEGDKSTEQNKPRKQADQLALLAKEHEAAVKEREEEKKKLRSEREKAEKDAAKR